MRSLFAQAKHLALTSLLSLGAVMLMAAPVSAHGSYQLKNQSNNKSSHETTAHKSYVCKYVGKPGASERLQGGGNPIWVDNHSLLGYDGTVKLGQEFKDGQTRSVVVAANVDKMTPEPSLDKCPEPTKTPCPPTPAPTKPDQDDKNCPPKHDKPVEQPKPGHDKDCPKPTPAPTEEEKTPTPPVGRGGGEVLATSTETPSAPKPAVLPNTGANVLGSTSAAVALMSAATGAMFFRRRKIALADAALVDFSNTL
jgi:LPXTG-motif cell wall-anchored protein